MDIKRNVRVDIDGDGERETDESRILKRHKIGLPDQIKKVFKNNIN